MSQFLSKAIIFRNCNSRARARTSSAFCSLRAFSITSTNEEQSFVASYLINSLGFSPKDALSTSRSVSFDSPEKPDKTVELFKGYGFTLTQISVLVRIHPRILVSDAEKTILPKMEFFLSKGISGPELAKGLSVYPRVLQSSLANLIVPQFEFFRNLFQSDETAIRVVARFPDILTRDIKNQIEPNFAVLQEHGVPRSSILTFVLRNPRDILLDPQSFREIVEEVAAMGFSPATVNFVVAVSVIRRVSKEKWQSKLNVYKKSGWSDEEVLRAFRSMPNLRMISEDKISSHMDFFTNELGWSPSVVARNPGIITMSLEKRVIPRCLIYQHLLSKGLLKNAMGVSVLCISNNEFLLRYVVRYEKEAPELWKLYRREGSCFKKTEDQASERSMLV